MNISRVIYVDPQSYSNLAKYDVAYLDALVAQGLKGRVEFWCSRRLDEPAPSGVVTRCLFSYSDRQWAVAKAISYSWSMTRLLAAGLCSRQTIYHFQWFKMPFLDWVIVRLLQIGANARVVFTAHNAVPHGEGDRRHRFLGMLYRTVDVVVVHSEATAKEIGTRFDLDATRLRVLPHGTIPLRPIGLARHRQRIECLMRRCELSLLFLGNGTRYKGLDLLLDAFRRAATADVGNIGLVVMGRVESNLRSLAQRLVLDFPEKVVLVDDFVDEADLFYAAMTCDVVVLPHRNVSQSGVLLSVLGLRRPVLVSRLTGLLEPLSVADVGWSFDGTEQGLAQAILALAADPAAVTQAADNVEGWKMIDDVYGWREIAREGASIYRALGFE